MNRNPSVIYSVLFAAAIATVMSLLATETSRSDVVAPAQPQALPTPLTLADAISIALHRQPLHFIATSQTQQALALKQNAQAKYFPTVAPTYNYLQQNSASSRVSANGNNSSSFSAGQGGVIVQEDILDNGQREVANAQARRNLQAAKDNTRNVDQQTILTVSQSYYQLLKSLDLVRVSRLQISRGEQEVALVQAEIDAGTAAKSDIFQAKSDLATALVSLSQNQTAVSTAASALKNAMGIISNYSLQPVPLPGETSTEASPTPDVAATTSETAEPAVTTTPPQNAPTITPGTGLSQLPPPPTVASPQTIDEYFAAAETNRPDLKQQLQMVEYQKLNVKQAVLNAGVSVTGSYQYSYFNNEGTEPQGSDSTLALTATYPLFDAGASHDLVKAAKAQLEAAEDQYEVQRQAVRTQIEEDSANRAGALDQTNLANAAVAAAQASYDSEVAQRQEGLATIFDITTAEVTLTQAQDQYVAALYNFYDYDAALQRDLGENDSTPAAQR